MALRHIEAFDTVMRCGTMTEAAEALHTSQPQISRLVAQLESMAGFKLFERHGSRLKPTQEGLRFHREVRKTFDGLTGLETAAAHIKAFRAERLSVAAMPRLAGGLLARVAADFKAEYPEVLVSIHSGDDRSVYHWVRSGYCDLGLAMLYDEQGDAPDLQVQILHRSHFVAVLPTGHPLARLDVVHARDLDGQRLVASAQGSSLRQRCDQILADAGARCVVTAEANLGSAICGLVAGGLGVGLTNPLAAKEEGERLPLQVRPFVPQIPIAVGLLFPQKVRQQRLMSAFVASARAAIERALG